MQIIKTVYYSLHKAGDVIRRLTSPDTYNFCFLMAATAIGVAPVAAFLFGALLCVWAADTGYAAFLFSYQVEYNSGDNEE